jgi:DNA-directed RNA polymerase specialized sigma24 family protein
MSSLKNLREDERALLILRDIEACSVASLGQLFRLNESIIRARLLDACHSVRTPRARKALNMGDQHRG